MTPKARRTPPTRREVAPLDAAGGVDRALEVPLSFSARARNAAKLRGLDSSALMANTMPEPQWLVGFVWAH
jgi:hypothetical protein